MSIQEQLDPAAADEVVATVPPIDDDFLHRVLVEEPVAAPGRLARSARATGRGLLALTLFVLGLAAGAGAGFGYGYGLVGRGDHVDLLPSYAAWPVLWWVLLATVPVAVVLAFWKRVRPLCLGYVLALPWQLLFVLVYAYSTYGTWGYGPTR
jgi:hypothetical protein